MAFSPTTIAAQRADLLRQVVSNRTNAVPSDDKRLFSAEVGLTVHAYMADVYAAALAELDPERAEEVARELAEDLDAGALPAYAWERAAELGHDPQAWRDHWLAGRKDLPLPGPAHLRAELERQDGEARFWHFEYQAAMDNYWGEVQHGEELRAKLEQVRVAGERLRAAHFREAARLLEDAELDDDAVNMLGNVAHGIEQYNPAPACTCGAEAVHQAGCEATRPVNPHGDHDGNPYADAMWHEQHDADTA